VLVSNGLSYSYDAFRVAEQVDTASSTSERVSSGSLLSSSKPRRTNPLDLDIVDFPG
jgi:hypothetical protein